MKLLLLLAFLPILQIDQSDNYQSANVPGFYIGNWTGYANQNNAGSWQIELQIKKGNIGEKVGLIKYPTLSCGGYLILTEIRDDGLVLKEYIDTGILRCINKGNLYLNLHGEGLSFYWDHDLFTESWAKGSLGREI